jgi:pre-60S factor REI1
MAEQYYEDEYEEEGLTCHTAPGVVFTSMDELKEHYRSDWHRYNLKRKVALLPTVGKELFERVMAQAGVQKTNEKNKQVGKGHLKRPEELPRSVAKAKRVETWIDHHQEEIAAAEAAQAEHVRRIAAGDELEDGEGEESEEEYEEDDKFDEEGNDSGWESMDEVGGVYKLGNPVNPPCVTKCLRVYRSVYIAA